LRDRIPRPLRTSLHVMTHSCVIRPFEDKRLNSFDYAAIRFRTRQGVVNRRSTAWNEIKTVNSIDCLWKILSNCKRTTKFNKNRLTKFAVISCRKLIQTFVGDILVQKKTTRNSEHFSPLPTTCIQLNNDHCVQFKLNLPPESQFNSIAKSKLWVMSWRYN
jgi:hypothetical protein